MRYWPIVRAFCSVLQCARCNTLQHAAQCTHDTSLFASRLTYQRINMFRLFRDSAVKMRDVKMCENAQCESPFIRALLQKRPIILRSLLSKTLHIQDIPNKTLRIFFLWNFFRHPDLGVCVWMNCRQICACIFSSFVRHWGFSVFYMGWLRGWLFRLLWGGYN